MTSVNAILAGWSPAAGRAPGLRLLAVFADAADPVADGGAGAVVAVAAGWPEVAEVVAAAEDDRDDVVDGGGGGAAAPALAAVACEGDGAQRAPARWRGPGAAHVLIVPTS